MPRCPGGGIATEFELGKFAYLHRRKVRRHGAFDFIVPFGGTIATLLRHQSTVGDHSERIIGGHTDVIGSFFTGGVIAREPARCAIGL